MVQNYEENSVSASFSFYSQIRPYSWLLFIFICEYCRDHCLSSRYVCTLCMYVCLDKWRLNVVLISTMFSVQYRKLLHLNKLSGTLVTFTFKKLPFPFTDFHVSLTADVILIKIQTLFLAIWFLFLWHSSLLPQGNWIFSDWNVKPAFN